MRKDKVKELYELRVITDNPVFEGFALKESSSLLGRDDLQDDITPGYGVTGGEKGVRNQKSFALFNPCRRFLKWR